MAILRVGPLDRCGTVRATENKTAAYLYAATSFPGGAYGNIERLARPLECDFRGTERSRGVECRSVPALVFSDEELGERLP